jgi:hypothetical protein
LLQGLVGRDAFDLGPISTLMTPLRVEKASVEAWFVREEEQSLGIGIEPSDGIDVLGKSEFRERPVRGAVGRELGEDSVGLVKGEKHGEYR